MSERVLTVVLPKPFALQADVLRDPRRFRVLACGRRWGKSEMARIAAIHAALNGGVVWLVLPSYSMAVDAWSWLRNTLAGVWSAKSEELKRIDLPTGGHITIRSGDNPDALRGTGLDLVVLDEAAYLKPDVWYHAVRPALSDRQGRALFISTPKGKNWFYAEFLKGVQGQADYAAWQYPTETSPVVAPEEIEAARAQLPAVIFQQEYMASFEDDTSVFRGVRDCIAAPPPGPERGHAYVAGVDWGQARDFTVVVVLDRATRQAVAIDRFNRIGWQVQRDRLAALAARWDVRSVLVEENSIGSPNLEALAAEGLPVRGFTTTQNSKEAIIRALMLAFERQEIRIPPDPVLLAELEAFSAERLPSGRWRYSAPGGGHDDCVIALALALECANRAGGPLIVGEGTRMPSRWSDVPVAGTRQWSEIRVGGDRW